MNLENITASIFAIIIVLGVILQIFYYFEDKKIKAGAFSKWQEQRKQLIEMAEELIGFSPNIDDPGYNEILKKQYIDLRAVVSHGEHSRYRSLREVEVLYQRVIECRKAEQLLREKYRVSGLYRGNDNLKGKTVI